jgi:hypothetical protein
MALTEEQLATGILEVAKERYEAGDFSADVQEGLASAAKEQLKDAATRSRVLDALTAYGRGEEPSTDSPTTTLKAVVGPNDPESAPLAFPQLAQHDMDVPEEPEELDVVQLKFDEASGTWKEEHLGMMVLVPTGCDNPVYADPYESSVGTISALPRDKQAEANLYSLYQKQGWSSRDWIREKLQENINAKREDERILDDIPFLNLLAGKPAEAPVGVGQTPGMTGGASGPGSSNGAPPPPGPGPGRGNTYAPGDDGASA